MPSRLERGKKLCRRIWEDYSDGNGDLKIKQSDFYKFIELEGWTCDRNLQKKYIQVLRKHGYLGYTQYVITLYEEAMKDLIKEKERQRKCLEEEQDLDKKVPISVSIRNKNELDKIKDNFRWNSRDTVISKLLQYHKDKLG